MRTKLLALSVSLSLCAAVHSQSGVVWNPGDVFCGVFNGTYRLYSDSGNFRGSFMVSSGHTRSGAFNRTSNADYELFLCNASDGRAHIFDGDVSAHTYFGGWWTGYMTTAPNSNSALFDSQGRLFVGNNSDSLGDLVVLVSPNVIVDHFDVSTAGAPGIDLARDERTLYFTAGWDRRVRRYDIVARTAGPDFANLPADGGRVDILRLLPPYDGSGGMLVADTLSVRRLDAAGAVVQSYDLPGLDEWYTIALAPDAQSFWATNYAPGRLVRFDLQTGAVLVGPIALTTTADGLAVVDEPRAANLRPSFDAPTASIFGASVGVDVALPLVASDLNAGDLVTIVGQGLPVGATLDLGSPAANPRLATLRWTPTAADIGAHDVGATAIDVNGNRTTLPLVARVAATYLVVGRGAGSATFTAAGHAFDTQLASVRAFFPVSTAHGPSFAVPISTMSLSFSAQVLSFAPASFPLDASRFSQRLRIQVDPGPVVTSSDLGPEHGMHVAVQTFTGPGGELRMRFPFTADGL